MNNPNLTKRSGTSKVQYREAILKDGEKILVSQGEAPRKKVCAKRPAATDAII